MTASVLEIDLRLVGFMLAIIGWATIAAAIASEHIERRHRRRRDDPMNDDNSVRITLPRWADQLAKHGPWVILSFVLLYALLYQPRPATYKQVDDGLGEIQKAFIQVLANQAKIENRMEEAQKVMYTAAIQRTQHDVAMVQLLTEICNKLADSEAGRRECRAAMRGQANQAPQ